MYGIRIHGAFVKRLITFSSAVLLSLVAISHPNAETTVKKIVFDEQRIEGKIRRPQLVLIKAEMRPEFNPMILQSFGKNSNITSSVKMSIFDESPNSRAFRFDGTKINNMVP
jgi:hypothetical protein